MLFTQELQEKLKSLCVGESKIVIEGFNSLGDPFVTKGRVAKGDKGNPVVHDNVVCLDFGHSVKKPYSNWVAPYVSEVDMTDTMSKDLIIKTISLENGDVLFENADAEKYLAAAKENMVNYKQQAQEDGRWIDELDSVSNGLMSLLGRPIRLDGEECILAELPRRASNAGTSMIQVRRASLVGGVHVRPNSFLEAVDLDTGDVEYVTSNKERDQKNDDIFKQRVEKIEKVKLENQPQPGEE